MPKSNGHGSKFGHSAWIALVFLATSCAENTDVDMLTPPACNTVSRWGNGATCSATDPSLASCGNGSKRTCASGWLCLDAPALLDCSCSADSDCEGRSQYINDARTAKGIAPLAAKCVASRCSGEP